MSIPEMTAAAPVAMPRGLRAVDRVVGRVSLLASVVGAGLIALMCFLMVADIIGRTLGTPIVGTIELVRLSIVLVAFLTIPYAMRTGAHVRSTILLGRLSTRPRHGVEVFYALIAAAVFGYVAWVSWDPMLFAIRTGEFEGDGALRVPVWPARTGIVFGSVLMAIESLLSIWTHRDDELDLTEVMP